MDRRQVVGGTAAFSGLMLTPRGARALVEDVDYPGDGAFRAELRTNLRESARAWWPRTLDRDHGGFLSDFDADWQATGPHNKRLEFQARQTRAAAHAALSDSSLDVAREAAEHGYRNLRDTMWDSEAGGFWYMLKRDGTPEYTEKHLHGIAYSIQACVFHNQLTGDPESLELANRAFDWADEHAHDKDRGGYFSFMTREGAPILEPSERWPVDPLGTAVDRKDCNTIMDMFDALVDLHRATGREDVLARIREITGIADAKTRKSSRILFRDYGLDWSPANTASVVGGNLQVSCVFARMEADFPDELGRTGGRISRSIVGGCLDNFRDETDGAFIYEGEFRNAAWGLKDLKKEWWVQAEAMRAFLVQSQFRPGIRDEMRRIAWRLWTFSRDNVIDSERKGWTQGAGGFDEPKVHEWKDASHEVRALMESISILGG